MPFSETQRNAWLDQLATVTVGLFLGAPLSGGVELTGGSYVRQPVTLAAAAAGVRLHTDQPVFSVPAGSTFDHVGYFESGVLVAEDDIPEETYGSEGTCTLTTGQLSIA